MPDLGFSWRGLRIAADWEVRARAFCPQQREANHLMPDLGFSWAWTVIAADWEVRRAGILPAATGS